MSCLDIKISSVREGMECLGKQNLIFLTGKSTVGKSYFQEN